MSVLDSILNQVLIYSYYPAYRRFIVSTKQVKSIQEKILKDIIAKNRKTVFGRDHSFSRINSYESFKQHVPLSEYEDYSDCISAIRKGEDKVLTRGKVQLLQPTSGSTAASKLIPYTKGLKKDFQRSLGPWLHTMLREQGVGRGKAYWSITPAIKLDYDESKVPIGFHEDTDYFGLFRKYLIKSVLAVPSEVTAIEDTEEFKYVTLLFLLKQKDISLFSFWNPSFLMVLLNDLNKWKESLISDVQKGDITGPGKLSDGLKLILERKIKPSNKRAKELREAFRQPVPIHYNMIWPGLSLISCWTDAHAKEQSNKLASFFPKLKIQPKGLMATEGIISFPLSGIGNVLAIRSHFFEFLEIGAETEKEPCLIQELKKDKMYAVIITTNGGLYRYQLKDIIKVEGFFNQCPIIRFMGKLGKISDIAGEKLNEFYLSNILNVLFKKMEIDYRFCLVAPESEGEDNFYVLYLQLKEYSEKELLKLNKLAVELDKDLKTNIHYNWCRKLSQLQQIKLFLIDQDESPGKIFMDRQILSGQKLGDIKPSVLSLTKGWNNKFKGSLAY